MPVRSPVLPEEDKSIRSLHQPFLLKAVAPLKWELNTYAQFDDRFEPRPYICSKTNFAWPVPPDPPADWFYKFFM